RPADVVEERTAEAAPARTCVSPQRRPASAADRLVLRERTVVDAHGARQRLRSVCQQADAVEDGTAVGNGSVPAGLAVASAGLVADELGVGERRRAAAEGRHRAAVPAEPAGVFPVIDEAEGLVTRELA